MKLLTRQSSVLLLSGCLLASCGVFDSDGDELRFGDSECAACLKEQCGMQHQACAGDPGCAAHLSCLDDCPESEAGLPLLSCEQACAQPESSSGQDLLADYMACRDHGAGTAECDSCTGGYVACYECAYGFCAPELAACYDDPACVDYQQCTVDCEDANPDPNNVLCVDLCGQAADPAVVRAARQSELCSVPPCVGACLGDEVPPCLQCMIDSCWAEYSACELEPGCKRINACIADCYFAQDQNTCVAGCAAGATPEHLALRQAVDDCELSRCNCH